MPANYGTNTILSQKIIFNDSGYYAQIIKEKYNDFPDHKGRPGQVGGSLPKGEGANKEVKSYAKQIEYKKDDNIFFTQLKQIKNIPTTKEITYGKAKEILKTVKGKVINEETNIEAEINSGQAGKLISKKALLKSKENGFTFNEHFAAATKIKELFKIAILRMSRKERNGDINIISIKKFLAPIKFVTKTDDEIKEKNAFAKINLRETKEHGYRVYTAELHSLEQIEQGAGLENKKSPV